MDVDLSANLLSGLLPANGSSAHTFRDVIDDLERTLRILQENPDPSDARNDALEYLAEFRERIFAFENSRTEEGTNHLFNVLLCRFRASYVEQMHKLREERKNSWRTWFGF
ncbi:hypothetical protein [Streptomyces sp. WAC06614]|uniref:hypothetical protein n=1 Tax=Streptomyces sp. WAC06614 TaxID=2487416 RepID=UPI000F7B9391|nr:hypothetical protein [Streptomyces sp. WAC06614]RSS81115.1 hypothetical protein EF918_11340 [Streptomyces sp. WAC06614]